MRHLHNLTLAQLGDNIVSPAAYSQKSEPCYSYYVKALQRVLFRMYA